LDRLSQLRDFELLSEDIKHLKIKIDDADLTKRKIEIEKTTLETNLGLLKSRKERIYDPIFRDMIAVCLSLHSKIMNNFNGNSEIWTSSELMDNLQCLQEGAKKPTTTFLSEDTQTIYSIIKGQPPSKSLKSDHSFGVIDNIKNLRKKDDKERFRSLT
jgi:hypothetical protein